MSAGASVAPAASARAAWEPLRSARPIMGHYRSWLAVTGLAIYPSSATSCDGVVDAIADRLGKACASDLPSLRWT